MSGSSGAETTNENKFRLRLLTFNAWHGLNHSQPMMMLPIQGILENWKRHASLLRGLRSYLLPSSYLENSNVDCLEVMALQEINPNSRLTQKLKKELGVEAANFPVNVGLRAGALSWPLFLEDGLSTLWRGPAQNVSVETHFLSGHGKDWDIGPLTLSAQFEERRGALVFKTQWGKPDLRFDIIGHSMGGLVARYFAMYGGRDLSENTQADWAGAQHINRLILIGTPNAGSFDAFRTIQLVHKSFV